MTEKLFTGTLNHNEKKKKNKKKKQKKNTPVQASVGGIMFHELEWGVQRHHTYKIAVSNYSKNTSKSKSSKRDNSKKIK